MVGADINSYAIVLYKVNDHIYICIFYHAFDIDIMETKERCKQDLLH